MAPRRLFFALWPDAATAERLRQAGRAPDLAAGRVPALADLHVTLCFLGAVEASATTALCERAALIESAPFELEFDSLQYWSRSRVLAATCSRTPAVASALAAALAASARTIGLRPEERPLRPHVTLVRGLREAPEALRRPWPLPAPLRVAARSFYLAQSQELETVIAGDEAPPRYARLASWRLRPQVG